MRVVGAGTITMCLDSDGINGVLDVLTDKGERRFVDLLRDGAQNALEVDPDLK
jgi:hypothetical protein